MALIKCKECGKEISDTCDSCIHCGCPISDKIIHVKHDRKYNEDKSILVHKNNNILKKIKIILPIILIIFIVFIGVNNLVNSNIKKSSNKLVINVFYGDNNSYCNELFNYLENLDTSLKNKIQIDKYEVWQSDSNEELMKNVSIYFGEETDAVPYIVINDKIINGFNEEIESELLSVINSQLGIDNNIVLKIKNENDSNNNLEDDENNTVTDSRTPKEKFSDFLSQKGYTTDDNSLYTLDYSLDDDAMYTKIDLGKQIYYKYDDVANIYLLTQYYFSTKKVELAFTYNSYYAYITWDLTTGKWDCNSSIDNWCNQYGKDYVSGDMNDAINEFNAILSEANITVEDIIQ